MRPARDDQARGVWLALACALVAGAGGGGCLRRWVNDSPALRWWLFSTFAAGRVCPEVVRRGVAVRVDQLGPNAVGRFFAQRCEARVDDAHRTMVVALAGDGYAHLPAARRVGFAANLTVEYRPDFRLEEGAIWAWGVHARTLEGPRVEVLGVENVSINLATRLPIVGDAIAALGQGVVASAAARGFTAVHTDRGDQFYLGVRPAPGGGPAALPHGNTPGGDAPGVRTTELHAAARDYLGPFEAPGDGPLRVALRVVGAPIKVTIVDRAAGDAWRQPYEAGRPLGPPPAAPLYQGTAPVGESTHAALLPAGAYYVVLENPAPPPLASVVVPLPAINEPTAVVTWALAPR